MNYVERLGYYADLERESPPVLPTDPPKDWPQRGEIKFDGVELRYRPDLPLVLKGLTFSVNPGEKVS
jgi:ABC-type multidrug transport system fused ATPase/permease subunit